MLKLTTDKHKASRGLSATAELLVVVHNSMHCECVNSPAIGHNMTFAILYLTAISLTTGVMHLLLVAEIPGPQVCR